MSSASTLAEAIQLGHGQNVFYVARPWSSGLLRGGSHISTMVKPERRVAVRL